MSRRQRRLLILGGKVAVAALLVGWLLHSNRLDFEPLGLFFERPELLVADLAVIAVAVVLGALRWRLLLELADIRLSFGRALQLHLTGLFFNIVIPGSIGGDVVKSLYVARDAASGKRPTVLLIAFVDRLIGVASLVVLASVVMLVCGRGIHDPDLKITVAILAAVTFVPPIVVLMFIHRSGDRVARWTSGPTWFSRILRHLVAATRLVSARPKVLLAGLALSIALHVAGMVLFVALASAISRQDAAVSSIVSIYPLGILSLAVPISFAGIGVGHVAFDRLFAMVGLGSGATVFNVFLIGQTAPCLIGVVPYLALRREAAPPEADVT